MSNPALSDVRARRAVIKTERDQIQERDKALAAEDMDLVVAERALLRLAGPVGQDPWAAPEFPLPPPLPPLPAHPDDALGSWATSAGWVTPGVPKPQNGTQEELAAWLLAGSVDPWATSNQIQAALSQMLQRPIPMSSVSPMLTIMKNKGIIVRDNMKVALASRVQTNRAVAE